MDRNVKRAVALAVFIVACGFTLLFTAVAIFNDGDGDVMLGGIILAAGSALVALGAWAAQRSFRDRAPDAPEVAHLPASYAPAGMQLPGISDEADRSGRPRAGALAAVAIVVACVLVAVLAG